jgi:hypothetical protein
MTTSPTFIPGYEATITLNADDFSTVGSVISFEQAKNVLAKPTFGSASAHSLGGQKSGTITASGHISAEKVGDLQTAFDQSAPIEFSIQIGDAAGPTDGGLYTGQCTISRLTVEANADGEWDWSLEAQTSGDVTYAPATP